MDEQLVLVTGGSGFIASHCIVQLLKAGYRVRTTVRSLTREPEVRAMVKEGGAEAGDRLSFTTADLSADVGWAEAVAGCVFVLHGASPTPSGSQTRVEDWINPAVDGVLRVLRVARAANVRRVVLTSAFGAVGVGHGPQTRPYNETDWTNLSGNVAPYQRSKTLSERAAWDFIAREGGAMELAVINPVAVLGPVLGPDYSHSIQFIRRMLDGAPGSPKINSGFVDVRDVADLHLRAMNHPSANGERFLATAGDIIWLADVARILRQRMGAVANGVSTRVLPNWLLHLMSLRNPAMKGIVPMLGVMMNATSDKAITLLDWKPRSKEDAIVATAESLSRLGLLKIADKIS